MTEKSFTIYSQKCPVCGQGNLEDAAECWNCHYLFPETEQKAPGYSKAEKSLIGLTIAMAAIIVGIRALLG